MTIDSVTKVLNGINGEMRVRETCLRKARTLDNFLNVRLLINACLVGLDYHIFYIVRVEGRR